MSYEEKGQWVYLIVGVLTLGGYVVFVAGQARAVPVADIDYVPALLLTIGIAIGLSILDGSSWRSSVRATRTRRTNGIAISTAWASTSAGSCSAWA